MGLADFLEATPTTTVEKKNTDRPVSLRRKITADVRRINLRFPSDQYYPVVVPSVTELGRWSMGLTGRYPELELKATKRDIASAFRLPRLRPALSLLAATEFPARHVSLSRDLICIYLVMPFGWNGSPANFARFGDAITLARQQCGLRRGDRHLHHSFRPRTYADDGIFIEINARRRLNATAACWGFFAKCILGLGATSDGKLAQEGTWESQKILIGFAFYLRHLTISLPENKRDGAEIFCVSLSDERGPHFLTLLEAQQLRGYLEHFQTTNEMWKIVKGPTDRLLSCADEMVFTYFVPIQRSGVCFGNRWT